MKICNNCGSENQENNAFCPACGGNAFVHRCAGCGAEFEGNFCPNCGAKAELRGKSGQLRGKSGVAACEVARYIV